MTTETARDPNIAIELFKTLIRWENAYGLGNSNGIDNDGDEQ